MAKYDFDPNGIDYAGVGGGLLGMIDSLSKVGQTDRIVSPRPIKNIAGHIESPAETLQRQRERNAINAANSQDTPWLDALGYASTIIPAVAEGFSTAEGSSTAKYGKDGSNKGNPVSFTPRGTWQIVEEAKEDNNIMSLLDSNPKKFALGGTVGTEPIDMQDLLKSMGEPDIGAPPPLPSLSPSRTQGMSATNLNSGDTSQNYSSEKGPASVIAADRGISLPKSKEDFITGTIFNGVATGKDRYGTSDMLNSNSGSNSYLGINRGNTNINIAGVPEYHTSKENPNQTKIYSQQYWNSFDPEQPRTLRNSSRYSIPEGAEQGDIDRINHIRNFIAQQMTNIAYLGDSGVNRVRQGDQDGLEDQVRSSNQVALQNSADWFNNPATYDPNSGGKFNSLPDYELTNMFTNILGGNIGTEVSVGANGNRTFATFGENPSANSTGYAPVGNGEYGYTYDFPISPTDFKREYGDLYKKLETDPMGREFLFRLESGLYGSQDSSGSWTPKKDYTSAELERARRTHKAKQAKSNR